MKRNKIKVLSSLAILGIAGISLIGCKGGETTTGNTSTPAVSSSANPTPTPTTNNNNGSSSVIPTTPTSGTNNGQTSPVISSTTSSTPKAEISSIVISGDIQKSFVIGDNFSYEGLVVTKIMSDGSRVTAEESEIDVKLYKDEDCEVEASTSNLQAGTYYVEVTVGTKFDYYEISVTEVMHTITEMLEFNDSVSIPALAASTKLLESNGNSLYVTGAASGKKAITSDKDQKYTIKDKIYDTRLNLQGSAVDNNMPTLELENGVVKNPNVLTLTLANDAKVTVAARGSGEGTYRKIIITDNGANTYSFLSEKNTPDAYTVDLKAGTYYIYADKKDDANNISAGSWYLYGIELQYNVKESTVEYSNLTVDTTNAVTNFNKGSEFSTDGLVVNVNTNYNTTEVIKVTDCEISGYDMNSVGKQTVSLKHGDLTATYEIQVINPNATVESIVVKTNPNNLVYRQGEELSLEGLVLTATDSDDLAQDVEYDATKVSHKVLNANNEDVTANFTTLTKGTYKVELTYYEKTTSYNVVILEENSGTFNGEQYIKVGTTSYTTELVVSYSDGTDADYSKYYKTIADSTDGYNVTYYSDEACTNAYTDVETAFAQVGTVYVKCTYGSYSGVVTINVKSIIEEFSTNSLKSSTNYSGQKLYESSLGTLTAMTNSNGVKTASQNSKTYIKFEKSNERGVILNLTDSVILQVLITGNGNSKKFVLADSTGSIINFEGNTDNTCSCIVDKTDDYYVFTVELQAGTYNMYSNTGGLMFAGIRLIK